MKFFVSFLFLLSLCKAGFSQDSVYLFSYFVENGKDGLHLAYSKDGLKWQEIH
ncbi:glycosyl hydrolase, partial [Pseudoxanthomonas sp. SGD-10]